MCAGPAGDGQADAVSNRSKVTGHVFISYVHEDSRRVDELQRMLEAAGIQVWRDKADLWPGQDWRAEIRRAITDNALVFIACFSQASIARGKSYQNEELTLAVEQLRQRPPDYPWLIPVRLDECEIPDRDIGGGRTLTSIQHADLFGDHFDQHAEQLVAVVKRILWEYSYAIHLTITEPPLMLNGTTRYRDLEQWLSRPVIRGRRGHAPGFPVRGRVEPPPIGGQMRIRIFTNQWHEQDGSLIYENGDFNCTAYINKQKPPARLELTVVSADGIDLVQHHTDLA
jgi:hypothetical protein